MNALAPGLFAGEMTVQCLGRSPCALVAGREGESAEMAAAEVFFASPAGATAPARRSPSTAWRAPTR